MDNDEQEPKERIPWSVSYLLICILLPALAGAINGFAWPAFSLYVRKMGWDLALGGMGITVGSFIRLFTQQVILRAGIWTCACFVAMQTTAAILALIYTDQAIVIVCQTGSILAFDVTVAIEGIVFDLFSQSEAIVSQAQSTVLSSFTVSMALSATGGGLIYDLADWKGMCVLHLCCAGGQLILMASQPALRQSFRTFLRGADAKEDKDEEIHVLPDQATSIVPAPDAASAKSKAVQPHVQTATLPGAVEDGDEIQADTVPLTVMVVDASKVPVAEKVEEIAADHDHGQPGEDPAASTKHVSRVSHASKASRASGTDHSQHHLISPNLARSSEFRGRRPSGPSSARSSCYSNSSHRQSQRSGGSVEKHGSGSSKRKAAGSSDIAGRLSHLSSMSPSGQNFQYNFGIMNNLRPSIASDTVRMAIQSDGEVIDERIEQAEVPPTAGEPVSGNTGQKSQKSKGLSRDMYSVAFLIGMCSFNNNASYAIEWATFAIFFKEQHGWTSATWAGICQTAGDLFAAFMMRIFPAGERSELSEMSGIRWFFHSATSQPYNLVLLALGWVTLNAGLCVPALPVAIASQVIMGTLYVYAMKAVTDMNLFYSLGDTKVFLQLQVQCRNADTLGNMLSGYFALALYEINPLFPFVFATGLSIVTCITVMLGSRVQSDASRGFCFRLGFGLDIETAEARRSRKLGMTRQSQWKSERMKPICEGTDDA